MSTLICAKLCFLLCCLLGLLIRASAVTENEQQQWIEYNGRWYLLEQSIKRLSHKRVPCEKANDKCQWAYFHKSTGRYRLVPGWCTCTEDEDCRMSGTDTNNFLTFSCRGLQP